MSSLRPSLNTDDGYLFSIRKGIKRTWVTFLLLQLIRPLIFPILPYPPSTLTPSYSPLQLHHPLTHPSQLLAVPSAPENLVFKAETFETLTISWSSPQRLNGIILSYEISYKELKVCHWIQGPAVFRSTSGPSSSAHVQGLGLVVRSRVDSSIGVAPEYRI